MHTVRCFACAALNCCAQLWAGLQHGRCRLTPFPVTVPWDDLNVIQPGDTLPPYFKHTREYFSGNCDESGDYVSDPVSVAYVDALLNDRSQFPYCGGNTSVRVM